MILENAEKYFLLAVEEMNFTRAAKRAYVTQQCLSKNIQQLENRLQVELFQREPKLALTPAGRMLYETLRRVELLENEFHSRLELVRQDNSGLLRLGINSSRGQVLLPTVYERYQKIYPNILVSVTLDDIVGLEKKLLDNQLDLFLGVNCESKTYLQVETVARDQIFLLATDAFLRKYMTGRKVEGRLASGDTLELQDFAVLPLAENRQGSTVAAVCQRFLQQRGITAISKIQVSDYATQIAVCGKSLAAAFCPQSLLSLVADYNSHSIDKLMAFHVAGLDETVNLSLVRPQRENMPEVINVFLEVMRQVIHENELFTYGMIK